MNQVQWRFAILLILACAVTNPALQETSHPRIADAADGPAWSELMACMAKMHVTMASVERSGNADSDFAKLMLPHHQAAIDMAKTELLYGKDSQMRRLAQEIVTDQQSEMELMQLWTKQHGASAEKKELAPDGVASKEH